MSTTHLYYTQHRMLDYFIVHMERYCIITLFSIWRQQTDITTIDTLVNTLTRIHIGYIHTIFFSQESILFFLNTKTNNCKAENFLEYLPTDVIGVTSFILIIIFPCCCCWSNWDWSVCRIGCCPCIIEEKIIFSSVIFCFFFCLTSEHNLY